MMKSKASASPARIPRRMTAPGDRVRHGGRYPAAARSPSGWRVANGAADTACGFLLCGKHVTVGTEADLLRYGIKEPCCRILAVRRTEFDHGQQRARRGPSIVMSVCLVIPPSPFLLDERVFMSLGVLRIASALEQAKAGRVEVLDLSGVSN